MKSSRILAAAMAAAFALAGPQAASAEESWPTDLVEYFYHTASGEHFFYSPKSVSNVLRIAKVDWTDTSDKGDAAIILTAEINCADWTFKLLAAKRFDSGSLAFVETVDLTEVSKVQKIQLDTMSYNLSNMVC